MFSIDFQFINIEVFMRLSVLQYFSKSNWSTNPMLIIYKKTQIFIIKKQSEKIVWCNLIGFKEHMYTQTTIECMANWVGCSPFQS